MILPFTKTNKAGQKITYWTHSSFINEDRFKQVECSVKTRSKIRNYAGFFSGIIALKLASIPKIAKVIPSRLTVPGFAFAVGLAVFGITHKVLVANAQQNGIKNLLEGQTLPLWKSKRNVVSVDRAFFHLNEDKNNQIDLLHHGLSGDAAARIFPDFVVGPTPKAPQRHDHGHGHGHGHGDSHGDDHGKAQH